MEEPDESESGFLPYQPFSGCGYSEAICTYEVMQYADNLVRVGVELAGQEDVRARRGEEVFKIKEILKKFENGKDYGLHEGYLDIFIELRQNKEQQIQLLFAAMKNPNPLKGVSGIRKYLEWQIERTVKSAAAKMNGKGRVRIAPATSAV